MQFGRYVDNSYKSKLYYTL